MKLLMLLLLLVVSSIVAVANEAPALTEFDPFEFAEGKAFTVLKMGNIASDADHGLRTLEWSLDSDNVWISVMGTQLYLGITDTEWVGTETFTLTVCDPEGACDSQLITMTVTATNDPPVLELPNQVIGVGDSFAPIVLSGFVQDADDAFPSLMWEVHGSLSLNIQVVDGVTRIAPPTTGWTGVEYVTFTVCDPEGACDSQVVLLARTDGSEQKVIKLGTAGFVVESQNATVAIDALYSLRATPDATALMRSAEPPFDIDIILVTHSHSDSFSAQIVATHMGANASAVLVGPPDVIEAVRSINPSLGEERLHSVEPSGNGTESLVIGGVQIEAGAYPHNAVHSPTNVGYLFSLGGRVFFHSGDLDVEALSSLSAHPFADRAIDVAFVDGALLQSAEGLYFINSLNVGRFIPSCFESGSYGCDCMVTGTERMNVLCLQEGLSAHLLPTE